MALLALTIALAAAGDSSSLVVGAIALILGLIFAIALAVGGSSSSGGSSRSISSYTSSIDRTTSATKSRMDRTSSDYLSGVRDTTRR